MHHHFGKLGRLGGMLIILAAFIASLLSVGGAWAAEEAAVIHKIRMGRHGLYTRLVFDAAGARPQRIGEITPNGLSIEFPAIETALEAETVFNRITSDIERVTVRRDESPPRVEIVFRRPDLTVRHDLIGSDPPRPGHYRLVLDFYGGKAKKGKSAPVPAVPPAPEMPARPDASASGSPPAVSPPPAPTEASESPATAIAPQADRTGSVKKEKRRGKDKTRPAEKPAEWKPLIPEAAIPPASPPVPAPEPSVPKEEPYQPPEPLRTAYEYLDAGGVDNASLAMARFKEFLESAPEGRDRQEALYGLADATFVRYQDSLAQDGLDVMERYGDALEAGKLPARTPVALYRAGLASFALEDLRAAHRYFLQLTSEYPDHPLVGAASLQLGKIYQQKKSYGEAVQTLKTALGKIREPLEKAEAEYVLGKTYSLMGNHEDVVQTLERCLEEDPGIYIRHPDLLNTLGESFFILRKYDQSRQALLWYFNLHKDVQDRDIILARIAETLRLQGEKALAQRIHEYVENHYPSSDGALAGDIRNAEELEKGNESDQEMALALYTEASRKPLSQSLDRLVHFKMAMLEWKRGEYGRSLQIIDDFLSAQKDPQPFEEFRSLRNNVEVDWLKRDYGEGNHQAVVRRFEESRTLFVSLKSPEIKAMVAESYRTLGQYPKAIEHYETMLGGDEGKRSETLFTMAQMQYALGDMDKAAELYRQVTDEALLPKAREMLGRIHFSENRFADAAEQFGHLLPKGREPVTEDLEWMLSYIESLMQTGKEQEACALVGKALPSVAEGDNDRRFQLLLHRIRCVQRLKQPAETVKVMEEAIPLTSDDDIRQRLRYELAGLYLEMGQKDKATERLSEIVKSNNQFWKNAAQQQLNYIQFHEGEQGKGS